MSFLWEVKAEWKQMRIFLEGEAFDTARLHSGGVAVGGGTLASEGWQLYLGWTGWVQYHLGQRAKVGLSRSFLSSEISYRCCSFYGVGVVQGWVWSL